MTTNENTPNAFYPRGKENSVVAPIVDEAFRRAFPDGVDEKKIGLVELCRALNCADAPRGAVTEIIRETFPAASQDDIEEAFKAVAAGPAKADIPDDGPVGVVADALNSPTALSVVKMLGTLLKRHPNVSIKDLEEIASTEYQQAERERLLEKYRTKPVREFVQFDIYFDGPNEGDLSWSCNQALELMSYPGEVRILIAPNVDHNVVCRLLREAADAIKGDPGRISRVLNPPRGEDWDMEIPF